MAQVDSRDAGQIRALGPGRVQPTEHPPTHGAQTKTGAREPEHHIFNITCRHHSLDLVESSDVDTLHLRGVKPAVKQCPFPRDPTPNPCLATGHSGTHMFLKLVDLLF